MYGKLLIYERKSRISVTNFNLPPSVIPILSRNLKHLAFPNKFPIFAAHLWDFVPTNECNLLLNN